MKCKRCESPAEEGKRMCRPHLDEACAQAKKAYADKKRAEQGVTTRRRGGGTTAVVKAEPTVTITRPVQVATVDGALVAIDEAIAGRLGEVQILERAKAILSRS